MGENTGFRDVFIARADDKFPGRFDYSQFEYASQRHASTVICRKHGPFQVYPERHLYANGGCVECDRDKWQVEFVNRANARFGFKFDYSKFRYASATAKGVIICAEHGEFKQCPDKHLSSTYGCPACALIGRRGARKGAPHLKPKEPLSPEEYLARFQARHGDKYQLDLSGYSGITKSLVALTCPKHGNHTYTASALLMSRHACRQCGFSVSAASKVKSYADFLDEANKVHKTAYTYPVENNETYVNRKSKVTIVCPTHGEFTKKAQKHLSGQGCWQCKVEELVATGKLSGGYGPRFFADNPEACDAPAVLYYLKVGSAYKVGITTNLYNRLKSIRSISQREVDLLDSVALPLKQAYDLEQHILASFKQDRTFRTWSTEVFSRDVLGGRLTGEIQWMMQGMA